MTPEQQAIARVEAIDDKEFETWYELGSYGWDSDYDELEKIIDTAMCLIQGTDTLLSDRMARARRTWEQENDGDDTILINTLERYRNLSLSTAQDAMGEVACNGYFLLRNLGSFTPEAQQWIQDNIQADLQRCVEGHYANSDLIPFYLDELLATEPDAIIAAQALLQQARAALPHGESLTIEAVNEIIAVARKVGNHTPEYKTPT
jgi:hypothetical protein